MTDSLITVEEAKKRLCIGTTLIYDLMKSGDLRRIKVGRKTLLAESNVQSFIQRKVAEAGAVEA